MPQVLTYTQLKAFRCCRKSAFWRYENQLVKNEREETLWFGSLWHFILECYFVTNRDLKQALEAIDDCIPDWQLKPERWAPRARARAMMQVYHEQFQSHGIVIPPEFVEIPFQMDITNPETGAKTPLFVLRGRVDAVGEQGHNLWIVEHKTTSKVDSGYLEKLWCDGQIQTYQAAVESYTKRRIAGILYDIIEKPAIRPLEVNSRRAKPETPEEYEARCLEKMREGESSLHQERILFDESSRKVLAEELWELQQQYRDAQRRGTWYQNTDYCHHWGRPCPYWDLCRSGGSEVVMGMSYRHEPAHPELDKRQAPIF